MSDHTHAGGGCRPGCKPGGACRWRGCANVDAGGGLTDAEQVALVHAGDFLDEQILAVERIVAARVQQARAEVEAAVLALADEYARHGAQREALGRPAWPNNVARDLRAVVSDPAALDRVRAQAKAEGWAAAREACYRGDGHGPNPYRADAFTAEGPHDFDPSDPDEDDAPADTCRQCGVLQGNHVRASEKGATG